MIGVVEPLTEGSPESVGLDPELLERAVAALAPRPEARALLVARGGALVLERYFDEADRDTARNVKSVTKSVQSALVGIALGEGLIASLDAPVADLVPAAFPAPTGGADLAWGHWLAKSDELRLRITLRDVLTMRSSLLGSDFDDTYVGLMSHAPDQVRFAASLPMEGPPGARFRYNTANAMLVNGVLAAATRMSPLDFARDRLFGPIGVSGERWPTDRAGLQTGGSELHLTARDMVRLGLLHLGRGSWAGRPIVPPDFVDDALAMHVAFATPPEDPAAALLPGATGYGLLWWHRRAGDTAMSCAWGYGGQLVCLAPALDLVVVTQSSVRPNHTYQRRHLFDAIDAWIVAAAGGGGGSGRGRATPGGTVR